MSPARAVLFCIVLSLQSSACDPAAGASDISGGRDTPSAATRVDTILDHLASGSYARFRSAGEEDGRSVLLVLRGSDVRTCEDLGRQARELQRWAGVHDARLVVWTEEEDSVLSVETFLRRERIRPTLLIRAALPHLTGRATLATPAALLVEPDGEVRGTAHPDRVPNVRASSFADELEALRSAADMHGRGASH
jgi:hypothetical protein